jgi:hypothetical protein
MNNTENIQNVIVSQKRTLLVVEADIFEIAFEKHEFFNFCYRNSRFDIIVQKTQKSHFSVFLPDVPGA